MADERWIPIVGVVALVMAVPTMMCVGLSRDDDDDRAPRPPPRDLPEPVAIPEPEEAVPYGGAAPILDDEPRPPEGIRIIVGTVRDDRGKALAGIEVTGGSRYDISDDRGRFMLNGQPAAEVEIEARAPGFLPTAERVPDGRAGEEAAADITLDPSPDPGGVVLDPDGRGADHARVACHEGPSVETDREGRFVMPPDAEGCEAIATHADHGASEPATLAGGPHNTLALRPPGAIAGVVVDTADRPIATFVVRIIEFVDAEGERQAKTYRQTFRNPRGRFLLSRLDRGRYVLAVEVGRQALQTEPLEVSPGAEPTPVRVVVP